MSSHTHTQTHTVVHFDGLFMRTESRHGPEVYELTHTNTHTHTHVHTGTFKRRLDHPRAVTAHP